MPIIILKKVGDAFEDFKKHDLNRHEALEFATWLMRWLASK